MTQSTDRPPAANRTPQEPPVKAIPWETVSEVIDLCIAPNRKTRQELAKY